MIHSDVVIAIGLLLCVGLLADQIGHRTKIPRVTLLLTCGILATAFGLIPAQLMELSETITVLALSMVAFLLGGSFKLNTLREHGIAILSISLSIVLATMLIVTLGLIACGIDPSLALVLASIATATAPAATLDVIRQSKISNGFTRIVQGVVAVDDAWGLLVFSVCLAVASQALSAETSLVWTVAYDLMGAVLLGSFIGLPAAFLTGRIDTGEPLLLEALAIAFLTAGLADFFHVSFLISGMTTGACVANLAQHHRRAFHEIEHIQWPFMILFFVLAGAALELSAITQIGFFGVALIVLRTTARLIGGMIGGVLANTPKAQRNLFGIALLPQAGVAIGMALLAGQTLPQWQTLIMSLTIGTTVVFELVGPFCAMWAVKRSART